MADKKTTEPEVETVEKADETAGAPIPNAQAEANHASQAPEDIRDGEVAKPNP